MANEKIDNDAYIKNLMQTPRVQGLRKRTKRCKCKYCGGKLRLKQIVYNTTIEPRIEIFCEECQRIEYGVEPEIYFLAKYYVDAYGCDYYPELDASAVKDRMNVGKVCEIIFWALNGLQLVNMEGFQVPYEMDKRMVGESIIYNLDALEKDADGNENDDDEISLEEVGALTSIGAGELRG